MANFTKEYLLSPEGQKQIYALDESIQRWKDKASPEGDSDSSCPLCDLNLEDSAWIDDDHINCDKCIIRIDTGYESCEGTPYYELDHSNSKDCKIMLDWLVGLKGRINDCLSA